MKKRAPAKMTKRTPAKRRGEASGRPSAHGLSVVLEAVLRTGARDSRAVRLDARDCADLVGELDRLRAPVSTTKDAVSKTWTSAEQRASSIRATVPPAPGCFGCSAASLGGPLACYRHVLEALLSDTPPCVCAALGLARCLPCRVRRMDRDLGALDAVSEAMWALQERYCDEDVMPTEVFTGAATMLNGAVRAASKRRESAGADDRVPSAPSVPATPKQVVPDSFRLECSKGEGGEWSVEASSAERGRTEPASNPMLSSAIVDALSAQAKGGGR